MNISEIKIELENEHQTIYNCYQQLSEIHKIKVLEIDSKPKVLNLLIDLLDYCSSHFKKEEAIAIELKIEIGIHKVLHNEFLKKLKKFINRYQRNLTSLADVLFFIKNWLKIHINKVDKIDFAHL